MPASNVEERVKKLLATHFEVSESEINRATAFNGEPPLKDRSPAAKSFALAGHTRAPQGTP